MSSRGRRAPFWARRRQIEYSWDAPEEPAVPEPPPLRALRRGPDGVVILDDIEPRPEPAPRSEAVPPPAPVAAAEPDPTLASEPRRSVETVGGPIHPRATIQFGRPPGTENRQAGAAALVGAVLLVLAAVTPWATRASSEFASASFGWRDANGALGSGWIALLLGGLALVPAIPSLLGRTETWLRVVDVVVAVLAFLLGVVEWMRIDRARPIVDDLSAGEIALRPGWGLAFVLGAAAAMAIAAAVHRTDVPPWRQA